MKAIIRNFFKMESAGGMVLVLFAVIALGIANSPWGALYDGVLHSQWGFGDLFSLSLSHWISDGLMTIFFLLIGLEVKRELLDGSLKSKETAIFPVIAAVGGMVVPALVYTLFNLNNGVAIDGWAIPVATDIAFALGIMALLGSRVPLSLKVFLLALAIVDDLGGILIIALFYTRELSSEALIIGAVMTAILFVLNAKRVTVLTPYLIVGAILWAAVLHSGIHATLAGVVIGFAIPLRGKTSAHSPLKRLEHALHPYVAFGILPLFALANAGISLQGVSLDNLTSMLPLGVALGLLIGKPIGIFCFSWIAVKWGVATLPSGVNMKHIFAVSVLCGIGFTMSIFIASLAFGDGYADYDTHARIGILMGSTLAAVFGYFLLRRTLPESQPEPK